jgi:septal ring factor EnvC (AmiA/AmiB activator)
MSGPIAAAHAAQFAAVAQRAQKKAEQAARGASVLANDDTRLTQAALQADAEEAALEALLAKRRNRSTQLSANANAKRAGPQAPPFETPENVRAGWPAAGRVVKAFGELDQNARVTKGATIAVRPGARVFAPAAGEIIYAGLFRSYGRLLIVQLVNDYAVVLAGVEEIHAAPGQRVKAGQPIARMAAGPSAGELYWEVRRNDRPIDPVLWSRDTARNEANRKRSNTRRTTSAQGAAQ